MSTTFPVPTNQIPTRRGAGGLLVGTAIGATALLAGTYYAYACSVLPGLARTDDRTFVGVMQQINEAIQNPVFFASFFGAPVLSAVAFVRLRRRAQPVVTRLVLAGLVLNALGLLSTMAFNIPLNDQLAAAGDPAHLADPAGVRARFETPWLVWNVLRAGFATSALGCLAGALHRIGRSN
jgi:uncharacterized membrane protein